MRFADAVEADRAAEFEDAANLYEQALAAGGRSINMLLNLTLLYWQATDFGIASANALPPSFVARAGERFPLLLDEARALYPSNQQALFWKKYIAWADLGEPLTDEECRRFLANDPTDLTPLTYLFPRYPDQYATQAVQLLQQVRAEGTRRATYIESVLVGALKRKR